MHMTRTGLRPQLTSLVFMLGVALWVTAGARAAIVYGIGYGTDGSTSTYGLGNALFPSKYAPSNTCAWLLTGQSGFGVIDFGSSVTLSSVSVSQENPAPGTPEWARQAQDIQVFMSDNPGSFLSPAVGSATLAQHAQDQSVALTGATGRYLKFSVVNNYGHASWASVSRLIFDGPAGTPVTPALQGQPLPATLPLLTYTASSSTSAGASFDATKLNDGNLTNLHIAQGTNDTHPQYWARLDLAGASPVAVGSLVFWTPNSDRAWGVVLVQTSVDGGASWTSSGFYSLLKNTAQQQILLPPNTLANSIRLLPVDVAGPSSSTNATTLQLQMSEIHVYGIPEPGCLALLGVGALTRLRRRRG